MKIVELFLTILCIIFVSCTNNKYSNKIDDKRDSICLIGIKYIREDSLLIPDHIEIRLLYHSLNNKNVSLSDSVKDILFHNISKKDRYYFEKSRFFIRNKDTLTLFVQTNYFVFDTLHKKTVNEIEKILNNNISLVIKKDTIPLINCK